MAELMVSLPTDSGLREAVGEVPGVEFVTWNLDGPPPCKRIDLVVPQYWGAAQLVRAVAEVEPRLVQSQSIGYDAYALHLPAGIPFANAATVHETSTAELAVGLALAAQRGIAQFAREGERHEWNLRSFPSLADRRVLLVGYGGVGKAIDARLSGFEVAVERVARSAREDRDLAGRPVAVRGLDELHEALAEAEIVILAVPLSAETRGLIDAAALAAMPDGALLVNVARGAVVDTAALVAELQSGRLRAALDVTDPEPLPADHPLWECPNLLITPHAGGDSSAMMPRMGALIRRQIEHLRAGEAPENLIEFSR